MNDNAKLWVDELENFKQAKGHLRDGDRFCCLGVACELYRRETGKGEWGIVGGLRYFSLDVNEHTNTYLPDVVMGWLGLTKNSGYFNGTGGIGSLAQMNDGGSSFEEIAAKIREEPEGLFVS